MKRLLLIAAGVTILVLVGWLVLIVGGGVHRTKVDE